MCLYGMIAIKCILNFVVLESFCFVSIFGCSINFDSEDVFDFLQSVLHREVFIFNVEHTLCAFLARYDGMHFRCDGE